MNVIKAFSGSANPRRAAVALLAAAILLPGGAAFAQCTLSGSVTKFEPNPSSGPTRPNFMNWIGINGFYLNQPSGASPRLLVTEAFGYHQVDLTDPQNPAALGWEDYRFSPTNPGPIPFSGDGHSSIDAMGISPDGARAAFAVNSSADSPNGSRTMLGMTGGTGWQIALRGETATERGGSIAVQQVGSRYLAYTLSNTAVYVSDVTSLPGTLNTNPSNAFASETTGAPGGTIPVLAGPYLAYLGTSSGGVTNGTINLVNVSSPGPNGNISSGFSTSSVTSADPVWARPSNEKIAAFHAAVDPSDGSAIYILAEFADVTFHSAGYSLIRYRAGSASFINTYRITPQTGESWGIGGSVGLYQSGGSLYAFMWAARIAPTPVFRLFSVSQVAFGVPSSTGSFDVDPVQYAGFGTGYRMAGLAASNKIFLYVPSGLSGWVVPTSCVSTNSPAAASLTVSSYGTQLSNGANVFVGDQIDVVAAVAPIPSQQALTLYGWKFDFDFHVANPTEDAGSGQNPRLLNDDNGVWGNPTNPPANFSFNGPCDPKGGGAPVIGLGNPGTCWNSVVTNSAAGGPDFTAGAQPTDPPKTLTFALQANNQYGSGGTATFALNWKVPAAKVVSTQILTGGSLVNGSDGHPTANGFKWYFGESPTSLQLASGCNGMPACSPGLPKGQHYYYLVATYPNGFVTPDYDGQSHVGQPLFVTDYAPAFTVNGSPTGPITAIISSQLSVSNNSQRGAGVTGSGGFFYSLCLSPCADNYVSWGTMGDAGSANIPVPGTAGTYLFKIKVLYTGTSSGTAYWPDPTGAAAFTVNVTNVIPTVAFNCPVGGGPGGAGCDFGSTVVNTGDTVTAYAYSQGAPIASPPDSWSMPSASPSTAGAVQGPTFSYGAAGTYTVTMNGYGTQATGTVHVNARTTPISVSASANPSSTTPGTSVRFTCSASGGSGSYSTYAWSFGDGNNSPNATSNHSYSANGNYTAMCTVTDTGGHQGSGQTGVFVGTGTGGPGGACQSVLNLFRAQAQGDQIQLPDPSGFTGAGFSVPWGVVITFTVPNAIYSSYSWNFGDGQIDTTSGATVTHTYPQASVGNRAVSLTVDGCMKSYPIVVTGTSAPSVSCSGTTFSVQGATYHAQDAFTPGGFAPVGVGTPTQFVAASLSSATATAWDWNWGDGTPHGNTSTATHSYAQAGTYTVTLAMTATDNSNGASGTCPVSLDVLVSGPSAAFLTRYEDNSVFIASNVLGYKNLVFTASAAAGSGVGFTWDFGDGTAHGSGQVVTHSFAPGAWTVSLSVSSGQGVASSTQPLTVVTPPEPAKWVVPGMAYVSGQVPGSVWQSDVTIFNPDPTRAATLSVAFLDARNPVDDGASLTWSPVVIPALGSAATANLLGGYFGQPLGAYGALLIRGDIAPAAPVVTARTFNNGDPTKGTFGLSVPSASVTGGVSAQASAAASVLIGLRQNDGAYTNLGLVNLKNDWPKIQLDFTDGQSSTALASMTVYMKPYQSLQINKVLQTAGYANSSDGYTVNVKLLEGGGVYPFATVIDASSTDPIVVTPSESPSNAYRIPGIVRLTGANGEKWRSSFTIGNPSLTARSVNIKYSYVPCDAAGCRNRVTIEGDIGFNAGQTLAADDFVATWLMMSAGIAVSDSTSYQSAFLDVSPAAGDPNQEPLVVLGETYNATPNGHVGLQIPGYTPQDGASRLGANKRLVLTGLASTSSYRTNLALFVVAGANGKWCNVHVYSPQGTKLRDVPVLVDGFTQVSYGTLFGGLSGDLSRLSIVVDNFDDAVTVGGYATIIDNTSGDATFVKAQPAP